MRRSLIGAMGLAVVLAATSARAADPAPHHEPTAGELGTARNALREGLSLREKGDAAAALSRLQTAYDLVPTPITGFELGKTHMLLGHVLQAHELFLKVGRMPLSLEESPRSAAARDEATKLAKELEPRIPTLRVKLMLPRGAAAVVKIDDEEIQKIAPEMTRLVDPGGHDVSAKAGDGPEQTIHVDVAESETKEVTLTPQWIAPKPAPATGPHNEVIFVRTTNPLTFVGFGFAAAGLLVTGVGVVLSVSARSDAAARCGSQYCPPSAVVGLPKNAVADVNFRSDRARYDFSVGMIVAGLVTTVIFGAIGSFGAVRPVKERVLARIQPVLSPSNTGLAGTF